MPTIVAFERVKGKTLIVILEASKSRAYSFTSSSLSPPPRPVSSGNPPESQKDEQQQLARAGRPDMIDGDHRLAAFLE